jgi:hypothetical protein
MTAPQNKPSREAAGTVAEGARDRFDAVKKLAEDATAEGRAEVGKLVQKVQDKAAEATGAVAAATGPALAAVRDAAVDKADEARETLSDVGQRLAATLERASTDAEGDALKSQLLTSVAKGLSTASDALRQRSVADLSSDVRALARRHPGAFMAAAAVVGFAAARFVRASAKRRQADFDQYRHRGPEV